MSSSFIVLRLEESGFTFNDCLSLIKEAFSEYLSEGLHYPCLDYTLESYIEHMRNHLIWVVEDLLSNTLVGVCSIVILSDGKYSYALEHHAAVSPDYKRKGIGSMMKEVISSYAKDKCEYMLATTAENATGAINWHKKNGYHIIRYASYSDTNYYSVVMRKQLGDHQKRYNNEMYCKVISCFSFLKVKLSKKADGSYTKFGSYVHSLIVFILSKCIKQDN